MLRRLVRRMRGDVRYNLTQITRRCRTCHVTVTRRANYCQNCGGQEFIEPTIPPYLQTWWGKLVTLVVFALLFFLIWKFVVPEIIFWVGYGWMWLKYFIIQGFVNLIGEIFWVVVVLVIIYYLLKALPGNLGKALSRLYIAFLSWPFTVLAKRLNISIKDEKKKKEKKDETDDD